MSLRLFLVESIRHSICYAMFQSMACVIHRYPTLSIGPAILCAYICQYLNKNSLKEVIYHRACKQAFSRSFLFDSRPLLCWCRKENLSCVIRRSFNFFGWIEQTSYHQVAFHVVCQGAVFTDQDIHHH